MSRKKLEDDAVAAPPSSLFERFGRIMGQLREAFVERDDAIECIALALLTGTNFLLVGEGGTAKTLIVENFFRHITEARRFTMLCGSFATEDKTFGPLDIGRFKEGEYSRVLKGRLGGVELAFLDEMFKSNEGCLNGMLTALNERSYDGEKIPLVCCGAASNWPEVRARTANIAALWDRMLLRCPVFPIGHGLGSTQAAKVEELRIKLLVNADALKAYAPKETITIDELGQCRAEVQKVEVNEGVRRSLVVMMTKLEKHRVSVSDRRLGRMLDVLRAAAWLDGKTEVDLDHFNAIRFGLWDKEEQFGIVKTVIDSIDEEIVQEALRMLQNAYKQSVACKDPNQAPQMLRHAADTAQEVKELLRKKGVRKSSFLRLIKPETEKVVQEYNRLKNQIANRLPKTEEKGAAQ